MVSKTIVSTRPRSLRHSVQDKGVGAAVLGLSAAMLVPAAAHAQQQAEQAPLATVTVTDTAIDPNPNAQVGVPYKAKTSGDERHSRPLAETPATISVLTRAQIEDSGYTDLTRILDAQPGITVGTGENGNAFGDRYIIRGQEARSDVFVDGLRDPGMTTRESFAIEQLEISKGPNSSFAGRGTSGGAINAITKAATTSYNFGKGTVGVGSDRFVRTTVDLNYSTGESFAVRVNGLYAYQEVPGRGPADRERKGFAASALYSPTDRLSVIVDYYKLRAHDNPDLGSYLIGTGANRVPDYRAPVYAQKEDFQDTDVDTVTGRIKYNFSDNVRLSNITRYGSSNNAYLTTGASQRNTIAANPGGVYATTVLDGGHNGWQEVRYFANQTNLYIDSDFLGGKNQFILGGEYTDHHVDSGTYTATRTGAYNCITTSGTVANAYCVTDALGQTVANANTLTQRTITRNPYASRKWHVETISGYAMDTVDLTSALTLFAGFRVDHYKFSLEQFSATTGVRASTNGDIRYSDTLFNGHLGLTYKVGGGGVFYVTAASAADINGGESDVGTSAGYGGTIIDPSGNASSKPERSLNLEAGTKWNILNEKLLLTAAIFQTTKYDVMESLGGADYTSTGTFNTGQNRVRGFEIGASGNITDAWSVQAGLTVMESKVQKSYTAANVGKTLANFAKFQFDLQSRYQFTDQFAMGFAVKHKSKRYGGQPDTAAPFTTNSDGSYYYSIPVPAYTVGDLFMEYKINNNMNLRLNVNNITDTNYYLAVYRSGAFLYKGDGRQVMGTLSFDF
ncbi:MAG TPA: TonB-dependent receptor [Sphingobium sp.]